MDNCIITRNYYKWARIRYNSACESLNPSIAVHSSDSCDFCFIFIIKQISPLIYSSQKQRQTISDS